MLENVVTYPPLETDPVVILDPAPTVRQHARGNKVTLEIPDEINALSDLLGRPAAEIIQDLLTAQVSAIRTKAKSLLGEVAL